MPDYLYIIVFITILVGLIIREIYLFNKDRYNPYVFRRKGKFLKQFIVNLGVNIFIIVCIKNIKSTFIVLCIFSVYSFCLATCISILNYLSYNRIKDKKIIFHTASLIIMIVIILIFLWRLVIK
ncbi:hypothetical protein Curi_c24790 [Gottschalkia acidurici 9a]|uniref:DUF4181 domain-containing protein n=1 Tax=Gottschalkia acidurici (strain ATCC 7906 / DSM 604 / BCRC 14475 / CIP 104303 / KCTC 5404 / NCIMB 10678 / 9a) TaxID=1128398 RepID=K0B1Y4_GOTA9|nr:hypothetical protein Curi_c24790 [Gottschalkia acidurici 9a]